MDILAHIRLLAHYNRWMNDKVYEVAGKLDAAALEADCGAFFGSVLGTLNHIMVGDTIWLKRLGTHPANHRSLDVVRRAERPSALDKILFRDLALLSQQRNALDATIIAWTSELTEPDLDHVLEYQNMKGLPQRKRFGSLVLNLFNHQTHHRGQATTLLAQAGLDVGVTDLLAMIPEEQLERSAWGGVGSGASVSTHVSRTSAPCRGTLPHLACALRPPIAGGKSSAWAFRGQSYRRCTGE